MAYNITAVEEFDHKRTKVTLDYGEVAFLLYKGECRRFGIGKSSKKSGQKRVGGRASEWDVSEREAYSERNLAAAMKDAEISERGNAEIKQELSDAEYAAIREEILIPRAKKRVLYYMKNADKTRGQIQRKLREGFYPDEVITAVMEFLDHYGFANDQTYAESYIEELRGSYSRREIEAKLMQRGLKPQDVRLALESLTEDDEREACRKALR
ncbi:MAG: regulatory protein RecX [Lachnospiraceae bacterium]|nr:regulatory protein RecX [Lachnospiraceae bacterium]